MTPDRKQVTERRLVALTERLRRLVSASRGVYRSVSHAVEVAIVQFLDREEQKP